MRKKVVCLCLILCLFFTLGISANAVNSGGAGSLRDVHPGDWYYDSCEYVYQNGYMKGTGDQMFSPDSSVTYAMAVQVLANLTEDVDLQMTEGMTQWYQPAIRWAERTGLEDGWKYADRFDDNPDTELTRRAFAKLIRRSRMGYIPRCLQRSAAFMRADYCPSALCEGRNPLN